MIVLIDNYDSFTYNLYQLVGELNPDLYVVRNDKCTVEDIDRLAPSHIIISPEQVSYLGRLFGTSGHRPSLRRKSGPRSASGPRQSGPSLFQRALSSLRRSERRLSLRPLSQPLGRQLKFARLFKDNGGDESGRDHGADARKIQSVRGAVPPRIHHDTRRAGHFEKFPQVVR